MVVTGGPHQTWFAGLVGFSLGVQVLAVVLAVLGSVSWLLVVAHGVWLAAVVVWGAVGLEPWARYKPLPDVFPWGEGVAGHPGQTWFQVFVAPLVGAVALAAALSIVGVVGWWLAVGLAVSLAVVAKWGLVKFRPGSRYGPAGKDMPWGDHGSWGFRLR